MGRFRTDRDPVEVLSVVVILVGVAAVIHQEATAPEGQESPLALLVLGAGLGLSALAQWRRTR